MGSILVHLYNVKNGVKVPSVSKNIFIVGLVISLSETIDHGKIHFIVSYSDMIMKPVQRHSV
jgi:hypothetical protein